MENTSHFFKLIIVLKLEVMDLSTVSQKHVSQGQWCKIIKIKELNLNFLENVLALNLILCHWAKHLNTNPHVHFLAHSWLAVMSFDSSNLVIDILIGHWGQPSTRWRLKVVANFFWSASRVFLAKTLNPKLLPVNISIDLGGV